MADMVPQTLRENEGDISVASSSSSTHEVEKKYSNDEVVDFKPTTGLYIAFCTLAIITLMVALDGTSLSVALPVSYF